MFFVFVILLIVLLIIPCCSVVSFVIVFFGYMLFNFLSGSLPGLIKMIIDTLQTMKQQLQPSDPRQSENVLTELQLIAAEIIRTLRKTSAGLRIEDVFSIEESSTNPEIQLFRKLLITLKSMCPDRDFDNFSSKFLKVIKQSQEAKKQVFLTHLIVFWIKFEGFDKHSQSRLRKLTGVQSQRPNASESQPESGQDEFQRRREQIFAQIAEVLDKQFEKSFNPGNHLFTCERVCCAAGCLWIITEIHEIYFLYFYRKSAKLRKFHHFIEPCMDRCSYCALCSYIIGSPIVILFIGGIIYYLVSVIIPKL